MRYIPYITVRDEENTVQNKLSVIMNILYIHCKKEEYNVYTLSEKRNIVYSSDSVCTVYSSILTMYT